MANTSYHRVIRKMVIGFGNLFDNITLVRYNPDLTEAERMLVPIVYATKELYADLSNNEIEVLKQKYEKKKRYEIDDRLNELEELE